MFINCCFATCFNGWNCVYQLLLDHFKIILGAHYFIFFPFFSGFVRCWFGFNGMVPVVCSVSFEVHSVFLACLGYIMRLLIIWFCWISGLLVLLLCFRLAFCYRYWYASSNTGCVVALFSNCCLYLFYFMNYIYLACNVIYKCFLFSFLTLNTYNRRDI